MQILPAKPYNFSLLLKPYAPALKAYVNRTSFRDSSRPTVISASIAVAQTPHFHR